MVSRLPAMIPPNEHTQHQSPDRRRPVVFVAITVVLAAAGIIVGAWALAGEEPPPPEPAEPPSLAPLDPETPAVTPDPAGSDAEQAAWATEQINADLAALTEAYAADDRDTYMGLLVPGANSSLGQADGEFEAQMGLYFDNMKVMSATTEWVLLREPEESTVVDLRYEARVGLRFCLAPTDPESCLQSETDYIASWDLDPEVTSPDLGISSLMALESTPYRPQPWEVAPLKVAVRDGVLIGATADAPYDPLEYVEAAQAAAQNAETFAAAPIGTYPIFLASDEQLNSWYGGYDMGASLGYAAYTLTDTIAADTIASLHIVLAADRTAAADSGDLLEHEAVHVATLPGASIASGGSEETWWLMEGIAEYGAMGDQLADYRTADTAALVDAGGCSGDFTAPTASASAAEISGAYGCAYLAVKHLVDTYGLEAFQSFFGNAHNKQGDLDEAAQAAFGVSYAEVTEGAAAAIAAAV